MDSKKLAWNMRKDVIEMTHISNGSHIGSILSIVDIIAVLYSNILNYNIKEPNFVDRDRVILSKGHAGAAIYSVLARVGFFGLEKLQTHYANGSNLSGHVSHKGVPGVEFSTGSLGHGMSVGAGMAIAGKKNNKTYKVYVILGDGECQEGAIWEAALFAHQFKLNNLVVIIDNNKLQAMGECKNIIDMNSFEEKWKAFGWNVKNINGHAHRQIKEAFESINDMKEKPTVIIANTIKGKGISFMENNIVWHYRAPQGEEYEKAIKELEEEK